MRYIQGLSYTFSFTIGEYQFNSGNNAFNAISIWKIDEQANEMMILQENKRIVNELQADAPHYHTQTMRINYLYICDLLLPKAKPSSLRAIYQMLTGDTSVADTTNEAKIDDVFWKIATQYLEGKAVDAVIAV